MASNTSLCARARCYALAFSALALSLLFLSLASMSHAAQPLSECPDPATWLHGDYYLTGDLACPTDVQIHLSHARLDLRGFSVTSAFNVFCHHCSITGPGTLTGMGGIDGDTVRVVNVTFRDTTARAVRAVRSVRLVNVRIENCWAGVEAPRASIIDSVITGSSNDGITAYSSGYDPGQHEVYCYGGKLKLVNSVVTGNNANPSALDCRFEAVDGCADIRACTSPRLASGSSCGKSLSVDTGQPFGICDLD